MTRAIALALTVLTGLCGLVYEVTFEKLLATLLGSHAEATAAVLGLFLGGMSLGYWLWGAVTRRLLEARRRGGRVPPLLLAYGLLEAGIGLFALALPALFQAVRALSAALPHTGAGLSFAIDVLLSALLVGPPAVLMGGTIPMLTQALARSLADATRVHALIYGFNTLGAFAGALAAGYWIVPALGLAGALRAMAALNLAAGGAFALLSRRAPPAALLEPPPAGARPAARQRLGRLAAVALLAGFAMMTLQTVLVRLGALSFGASQFTFSMVVAVFVLCIALGSFAVSALPRVPDGLLAGTLLGLLLLLALLYPQLQNGPYWAHALRALFRDHAASFYPFHLAACQALLLAVGPAVLLSGAVLPLAFHELRREVGGLGDVAGRLYAWNTLGSLAGALLGGYALLFWLDLHAVYRVALAAVAAAAALALPPDLPSRRATGALLFAGALAGLALLPAWDPGHLTSGLFRTRQPGPATFAGPEAFYAYMVAPLVRSYSDGPVASVAVLEQIKGGKPSLSLITNGKSDGSTGNDYPTMALAGILPALFAERPERAFVIGYGLGITAGELASLSSVREVVVAEISPDVIEAAPLFDSANGGASLRPELRIVRGDAYRTLLRSEGGYDVISSEPSNPWVQGVEMLYSREFLEAARERLTPGGVYAQWVHTYEIDDATLALVLRTYASVFEHVSVWYGRGVDLLLLGLRDASRALDVEQLERRAAQPDFRAALARSGVASWPELLAHELLPLGVLGATGLSGEIHTLLHPRLSYLAARAFHAGGAGSLPVTAAAPAAQIGRSHSLVRRFAALQGGELSPADREAFVARTCELRPRECATLLAEWIHARPESTVGRRLLERLREQGRAGLKDPLAAVERLAPLFGVDGGPAPDGDASLARANEATSDYALYYHHAAPFDPRSLRALWERCAAQGNANPACREGRARAEQLLGGLPVVAPED